MTDEELIARLRDDSGNWLTYAAAGRIKALGREKREAALDALAAHGQAHDAYEAQLKAEARLAKAVEALRALHHAVCGETGFVEAVRTDSGKAYPWPALDEADALARAVLAEIEGGKKDD